MCGVMSMEMFFKLHEQKFMYVFLEMFCTLERSTFVELQH